MSGEHPLARRLADGRILLRYYGQEPDGDIVDGSITIGPEDPKYHDWDAAITRWEHSPKPLDDSNDYEPIDYENLTILPGTRSDDRD
ncbi:hypothetical protein [Nocardia donostiensis]|uniref:Uncharacterized protein n=1 Tax=Nocardia donostiensis TaxID=1538463 RepID=A0A1V2TB57_9NOCA|nr:hypothetical protein [Nocardia donostiensis]ONM46743.1 hypothetical protein B0T46_21025 [Nocardia donostiensis]OQS16217.1 hypothetical protein B0T36_05425 [Nocardia donostiensis]OQS19637.1 hypothetical protein B0T44_13730 [Nocardia donostiensis]